MPDPAPVGLTEAERLHMTNLREAWRIAAPVYTDLAATDVEWLCTIIDRLSAAPVDDRERVPEGWRVEWTAGSPWWNGKPRLVPVFPSVDPEEGSSEAADHAAIAYLRNRGVTDPDSVDPEEG